MTVIGLASRPSVVSINGSSTKFTVDFVKDTIVLYVPALGIPMDAKFTLDWI